MTDFAIFLGATMISISIGVAGWGISNSIDKLRRDK